MHAAAMGADAVHVKDLPELKSAMVKARAAKRTQVLVIDTTHTRTTQAGGCWWEVGIPEVSERPGVNAAYAGFLSARNDQRV
jgi:3D-(3,5/4)-trihydroxycyclohexane-1,2-dione acylhydrolase (decyclizing)